MQVRTGQRKRSVLIETLWNVNQNQCGPEGGTAHSINRNIVECKYPLASERPYSF